MTALAVTPVAQLTQAVAVNQVSATVVQSIRAVAVNQLAVMDVQLTQAVAVNQLSATDVQLIQAADANPAVQQVQAAVAKQAAASHVASH